MAESASGVFALAIRSKGLMPRGFANPVREARLPEAKPARETKAYTLEEIQQMLHIAPEPARTAVAVAAFTGLRRSEIRGLEWQDYGEVVFDDGNKGLALHVVRGVWGGIVTAPKTEKSAGYVPVIPALAAMLAAHRKQLGNPTSGPIFPNGEGNAACLNNMLTRDILPVLKRCAVCNKSMGDHSSKNEPADHPFKLDEKAVRWHRWHAFRRGLATNLHRLGVPDKVIQRILRHANVSMTQQAYIKTVDAEAVAAMSRFAEEASRLVQ